MTTTVKKVQQHIEQRFTRKVLRYFAGTRTTDPVMTLGGRMGMTESRANKLKGETRELILKAAGNIQAGKQ
jgi:hypothetical protein